MKKIILEAVDSTQLDAKRRLAEGERAPFVIRARSQTAGRGRHGNAWESSPHDLLFTVVIAPLAEIPLPLHTQFFSGWTFTALNEYFGDRISLKMKWPNDLWVMRPSEKAGKVSGVLIEAHEEHLLVGIGINFSSDGYILPESTYARADLPGTGDAFWEFFISFLEKKIAAFATISATERLAETQQLREQFITHAVFQPGDRITFINAEKNSILAEVISYGEMGEMLIRETAGEKKTYAIYSETVEKVRK